MEINGLVQTKKTGDSFESNCAHLAFKRTGFVWCFFLVWEKGMNKIKETFQKNLSIGF